jgi:hypothetical protein
METATDLGRGRRRHVPQRLTFQQEMLGRLHAPLDGA